MISIRKISKTFNRRTPNEVTLFNDFNFDIQKNDFVIVVGSNGSGKSTLLNIIAGAVKQDEGSIHLDDIEISTFKDYQRSRWIARIFQNPLAGTAPELTVLENFRLASLRTSSKGLRVGT